jgi:hypothetical protein
MNIERAMGRIYGETCKDEYDFLFGEPQDDDDADVVQIYYNTRLVFEILNE